MASVSIASLVQTVIKGGASDLHISSGSPPLVRVNGRVRKLDTPPFTDEEAKELIYSLLTEKQKAKFEKELELDCAYAVPDVARFRVNVYQQKGTVSASLRLIPTHIPEISDLGLPPIVEKFAQLPRGLVLITGPTGSGKTTTLAALINRINRTRYEHIVTIEDPIEFVHESINCLVSQREVGDDKDTKSFKQALVSSLRQDPDVILVGEMRDLDTMETAVTAAETGHLVFGTLHTQNAVQSVERVVNVFGEREQDQIRVQLAATLQGICSQILIPTSDGSSRVPAVEVLLPTSAVRSNIRDHKEHLIPNSIQTGMQQGMQSMDYSLAQLVKRGLIDREVALAKARDENEFKSLLAGGAGSARFTSGG